MVRMDKVDKRKMSATDHRGGPALSVSPWEWGFVTWGGGYEGRRGGR